MQDRFTIGENETAGEVHDRMMEIGAALLLKTVKGLAESTIEESAQSTIEDQQPQVLQHAPKIFTETCEIDFSKTVQEVFNLIRGLSPYPAAFTFLNSKKLKIYRAEKMMEETAMAQGTFDTDGKSYLKFACRDGYISVLDIQLEGKKRMDIKDFLRGYRFE